MENTGKEVLVLRTTIMDRAGASKYKEGDMWREIAMPAGASLFELAKAILESIDFDMDHMFMFTDGTDFWDRGQRIRYEFDPFSTRGRSRPALNQVFTKKGDALYMLYDYGDEWVFKVKLVGFEESEKGKGYPRVGDSRGEAPEQYPDEE